MAILGDDPPQTVMRFLTARHRLFREGDRKLSPCDAAGVGQAQVTVKDKGIGPGAAWCDMIFPEDVSLTLAASRLMQV
jgi:hypothetical protein